MATEPALVEQTKWVEASSTNNVMHGRAAKIVASGNNKKMKTTWSKKRFSIVTGNKDKEHSYIFPINTKDYHTLVSSNITAIIPNVVAKKGYFVRPCNFFLANLIKRWSLTIDTIVVQQGDSVVTRFDLENRKNYNDLCRLMGNNFTPQENFPEQKVSIRLPFGHNKGPFEALPLYLFGSGNKIFITLEMDLDISKCFVMYHGDEIIPFDFNNIERASEFSVPTIEYCYNIVTEEECKHGCIIEEEDGNKLMFVKNHVEYHDDPRMPGDSPLINFVPGKGSQPVVEIFWGAINIDESEIQKELVFTHNGKTPIVDTTLKSTFEEKLNNTPSYATERSHLIDMVPRIPEAEGFNYWFSGYINIDSKRDDCYEPGENFVNGLIQCNLKKEMYGKFKLFCYTTEVYYISVKPNHTKKEERYTSTSIVNVRKDKLQ